MEVKPKVLIISAEVWRENTNGGNVLSNLFQGMDFEFAQIYCNPGEPQNQICRKYFQLTDFMMLKNIIVGNEVGKSIHLNENIDFCNKVMILEPENKKLYDLFRAFRMEWMLIIRELFWKIAKWKSNSLRKFILEFNPDIIFAPCYASHYMLRLTRYVATLSNKKVISYISDDNYSLKQWNLSPLYWVNRLLVRKSMRKTFPFYNLLYTMTEEQKLELSKVFSGDIKILRKGSDFITNKIKNNSGQPIRIIYAGGIYCGRWKTLAYLGEIIKKINKDGIKMRLDIYTQNTPTSKQIKVLNDDNNIFLHKAVSLEKLKDIYSISDLALHVESFEKKYKYLTRLSFSTKIVDCLQSGCAVMAIAWKDHAGLKYLQKEDAAICVDSLGKLEEVMVQLCNGSSIIIDYKQKAWGCGIRNHQIQQIQDTFRRDILGLIPNSDLKRS